MKSALISSAIGSALIGSATAAISIGNTASGTYDVSGASAATVSYSLGAGGNAVVFGTYADAGVAYSSFQFAGVPADGVVTSDRVALAYFFNPAASGDFTFDTGVTAANAAYFLYELNGVDLGATVDIGTGGAITTTDSRFVLNFIGANNSDGATLVPGAGSIASLDGVSNANGSLGGGSVGAASGAASGAGDQTLGWDGFGGGFPQGEVSIGLSPVPEPSSSMLLLGGLGILAVSRRRLS